MPTERTWSNCELIIQFGTLSLPSEFLWPFIKYVRFIFGIFDLFFLYAYSTFYTEPLPTACVAFRYTFKLNCSGRLASSCSDDGSDKRW